MRRIGLIQTGPSLDPSLARSEFRHLRKFRTPGEGKGEGVITNHFKHTELYPLSMKLNPRAGFVG